MDKKSIVSVVLVLAACAAPQQDDTALREQQMSQPLSENLKQDGKELKDQAEKDLTVLKDQVSEDGEQAGKNVGGKVNRIGNNVRDRIKITGRQMREWWLTPLPPEPELTAVPPSYCYKVLQDVLCYRQVMPGWEQRLVGYQGTHAETPPAVVTKMLPLRTVDGAKQAELRAVNSKPVFVSIPPEEKKEDVMPQDPTNIDAAHENLPDPALAPQL